MTTTALAADGGAVARRPLASLTLSSLARYFASKGHRPSDAMWDALADLTVTLEAMAHGEAPAKFFLSSLDPGVGKTQTITHFVDTLLSQPSYSSVGVLICVARLSEITGLIDDMAIPFDNLAVITSDAALNALGNTVLDYRDTLPDDLAPMVILDASGRVRETYRDIEESRGTLVRLKTAAKRYDKHR